ncbi:MAG: DEAD/DEAH box helicase family protein [Proteobacteria bacterium]|nr:DEAD/DEAH box helicase family protein [Pseudomonadota bacterium]
MTMKGAKGRNPPPSDFGKINKSYPPAKPPIHNRRKSRIAMQISDSLYDMCKAKRKDAEIQLSQLIDKLHQHRQELNSAYEIMSFLDISIYAPFKFYISKPAAKDFSEFLFEQLVNTFKELLPVNCFNAIWLEKNTFGASLLSNAIDHVHVKSVKLILQILGHHREMLGQNLADVSKYKSIFYRAVMTGNNELIKLFLELYQQDQHKPQLALVLDVREYMVILACMIRFGTLEDLISLIALLSRPEHEQLMINNLKGRTICNDIAVMHEAIDCKDIHKLRQIFLLLKKKKYANILVEYLTPNVKTHIIAKAIASQELEIYEEVIALFLDTGNQDLLDQSFDLFTLKKLSCLHLAVSLSNTQITQKVVSYLQATPNRTSILQNNLMSLNKDFMIFNDAIKTGMLPIIERIKKMLMELPNENILSDNILHYDPIGISCFEAAIESGDPQIVDLFIDVAQKVSLKKWQDYLRKDSHNNRRINYVQQAASSHNFQILTSVINAYEIAFSEGAHEVLSKKVLFKNIEQVTNSHIRSLLNRYLTKSMQLIEREDSKDQESLPESRLLHFKIMENLTGSFSTSHFDIWLSRDLPRFLRERPQELSIISRNGHCIFSYIFLKAYANNDTAAKAKAEKLFDKLFEYLCQQPSTVIQTVMSSKITSDGADKLLLQQALGNDFGNIANKLLKYYSTPGNERLLQEQISQPTFLNAALISHIESNVDFALALLSKEEHCHALIINLNYISANDCSILGIAAQSGKPEIALKIIKTLFSIQIPKATVKKNIEALGKNGRSVIHYMVNRKFPEETLLELFKLMALIYGAQTYEMVDYFRLASNARFHCTSAEKQNFFELYKTYPFAQVAHEIQIAREQLMQAPAWTPLDNVASVDEVRLKEITLPLPELTINTEPEKVILSKKSHHKDKTVPDKPKKQKLATALNSKEVLNTTESIEIPEPIAIDEETPLVKEKSADYLPISKKSHHKDKAVSQQDKPKKQKPLTGLTKKTLNTSELIEIPHSIAESMPEPIVIDEETHVVKNQTAEYVPLGGIDAKYFGGPLPPLPLAEKEDKGQEQVLRSYTHNYALKIFNKIPKPEQSPKRREICLSSPIFKGKYVTSQQRPKKDEQVTFVIAGRQEEAMVPTPDTGRCVLVLTLSEYAVMQPGVPAQFDMLVLEEINSKSHGHYDNLQLPLPRIIGIFMVAYYFELSTFMIIDDNIKNIKFNFAEKATWEQLYSLMMSKLGTLLCASVKTASYKEFDERRLGSKCLIFNMDAIRKLLPRYRDLFVLFPQAKNATFAAENYYYQIALQVKAAQPSLQYQTLDENVVCLTRSKKKTHACVKVGIQAHLFDELPADCAQNLSVENRQVVEKTRQLINDLIQKHFDIYQERKRYLERVDLPRKHALANHVDVQPNELNNTTMSKTNFKTRLQTAIKTLRFKLGVFRDYQLETFQAIGNANSAQGRILIPTAGGKTKVQIAVLQLAYHLAVRGEKFIVITAFRDLVQQFYYDFIEFNKNQTTEGIDLRIPEDAILKVCSQRQSCRVKAYLMNQHVKNIKNILIFCSESMDHFLKEEKFNLPNVPLILLDEYHCYPASVKRLFEGIQEPKPILIGSTATPPANDLLVPNIYRYTRIQGIEQGYLAPIKVDKLDAMYSREHVDALMSALPCILENQIHPGYFNESKTLKEVQGVIYLPSIKDCKKQAEILKARGIRHLVINSQNKEAKQEVEKFLANDQPCVLLAVHMLRIGFNSKRLAYIIFAQSISNTPEGFSIAEQTMGRAARLLEEARKIGYFLCFDDHYDTVFSKFKQPMTQPVNIDYLSQVKGYYRDKVFCKKEKRVVEQWKAIDPINKPQDQIIRYEFMINPGKIEKFHFNQQAAIVETQTDESEITPAGERLAAILTAFGNTKSMQNTIIKPVVQQNTILPGIYNKVVSSMRR